MLSSVAIFVKAHDAKYRIYFYRLNSYSQNVSSFINLYSIILDIRKNRQFLVKLDQSIVFIQFSQGAPSFTSICKHWITFKKPNNFYIWIHFFFNLTFYIFSGNFFECNINQVLNFIGYNKMSFPLYFDHLKRYSDDFGSKLCHKIANNPKIVGVYFTLQRNPQQEVKGSKSWRY